jgi:putative DNA primase/helicase
MPDIVGRVGSGTDFPFCLARFGSGRSNVYTKQTPDLTAGRSIRNGLPTMILSNGSDFSKGDHRSPTERFLRAYERTTGTTPKQSCNGWTARCPAHDDHRPSLSISTGEDGRTLVICRTGCKVDAVCAAVGLKVVDLMPMASTLPTPRSNGTPRRKTSVTSFPTADDAVAALERQYGPSSALWTYRDVAGEPVGQVIRWDKSDGTKDIRPVARQTGGWQIGGMPEPRPLYALPDVIAAVRVFIVEGEKAADAARSIGLVATTSAHGSNSAAKTDWSPLAGKDCVIIPDNDAPGRKYAHEVAMILSKLSPLRQVRIAELTNLPDGSPMPKGGDIADWIDGFGDGAEPETIASELLKLADQVAIDSTVFDSDKKAEGRQPKLLCMADVVSRPVSWLWPQRIALGRLTLLVGMPGVGKSFFTCDLASRVSTGTPFPDDSPCDQGSVIFITCEDDPSDTIRPRLDAHRAEVRHISLLQGSERTEDGKTTETMFTLADIDVLEKALQEVGDCRLVIIDPIGSFIGGGTDAHRDNEVRSVLAPVAKLAEHYGVAVLVVAHSRKGTSTVADDLALGSRAFTGIARSVWHLFSDPEEKSRRLLLPGKNNLAAEASGLAFSIAGEPAAVHWERDPVAMNANEILTTMLNGKSGRSALDEATAWLGDALADGPRIGGELKESARKAGISNRTLERARVELRVECGPDGFRGPWTWRLPGVDAVRGACEEFARGEILAD